MQNKNMWIGGGVVLVTIGVIFLFGVFKKSKAPEVLPEESNVVATPEVKEIKTTTPVSKTKKVESISYADALIKYADKRIQLDNSCQAFPNTVTYKGNTGIMIDNRSKDTRIVKVDKQYTIKPFDFKIVVLPEPYSGSNTILVDCGSLENVATILVQK